VRPLPVGRPKKKKQKAHSHPKCNGKYKKQDIGVGLR